MPNVRFATSGDVSIAYDVIGDGPVDIVYVQGASSHLEVFWELPAYRASCERIADLGRLIRFDKRGMGMSDRVPAATSLETRMDDIRVVMDAVGSERAAIIGESEGGPLAMLFAAAHPERTRALILQGAEVRERRDEDWPWGEATPEGFEERMRGLPRQWGSGASFEDLIPSVGDVDWGRAWLGRLERNAGTPGAIEGFKRMAFDIDVRDITSSVNVPTLIFHAVGDRICNIENARFLAREIPSARYVELEGGDHLPWFEAAETFLGELRMFLTGDRGVELPARVLATVLFTDIVDSTATAAAQGDHRWSQTLAAHHAVVARSLKTHGGELLDMAGDGVLASFDGPARAIQSARLIQREVAPLGLHLRAGVHTGEVERVGNSMVGIAVHIGARVMATAGPDEIWVSGTVRELTAGSGLTYEDRGLRELKGVPGRWHLYSVA